jgi:hypothetical protein
MTRDEKILYFLGQIKANIDALEKQAREYNSQVHEKIAYLKQFVCDSVDAIYFNDEEKINDSTISAFINKHHE